jgi:PKD repeat protein
MVLGLFPVVALGLNLLANPSFDEGLAYWGVSQYSGVVIEAVALDGRTAAHIGVLPEAQVSWPNLSQWIDVAPGDEIAAEVDASRSNISDGYGVYTAVEFWDASPNRISFTQSEQVLVDGAWMRLKVRAIAPPGSVRARYCLLLNGHGDGYFDEAALTRAPGISDPPQGPVTLTVTDNVVCDSLIGIGAEDDGWFYNPENMAHGITDEDIALRESRIAWMNPDWVRMFMWHYDWCPSGDWETFTFDSENMRSHYRTLDLYQRLGTRVNLTGVEWGMPDAYRDPEAFAHAVGELFEYLIRTRGYTCIADWTLTNEPNLSIASWGYTFADSVHLQQLVEAEFAQRGLAVNVVASDESGSPTWFQWAATDDAAFAVADLYASHTYMKGDDRLLAHYWYDDRLSLLASRSPRKPFTVTEFGFQDERSGVFANPLMETYPYAVWTIAFIAEGLNRGVAGFTIWAMHEVYYPGSDEIMNYALWDFKDADWRPRPVYHAVAQLTRLTESGQPVRECISSHPDYVIGAVVGGTLFWANRSDQPVEVEVVGLGAAQVRIVTEATLFGDRECGDVEPFAGRFTAPPQSFGHTMGPPVADFLADVTRGSAPLEVAFIDLSAGDPGERLWSFGDGGASTERDPAHRYERAGSYTVSLAFTTAAGSSTETKEDYVRVTFPDAPPGFWACWEIFACLKAGIVGGFLDGTYRPAVTVTRDQMAVFVSRALAGGEDLVPTGPATATFPDVPTDHWAYKHVEYAVTQNVVQGYDNGTYRPTVVIDRGQTAVFIARAMVVPTGEAAIPDPPVDPTFPDVPTGHWAYKHIEYCVSQEVVQGYDDGTYRPAGTVTRDQMAVFVQRAFKLPT